MFSDPEKQAQRAHLTRASLLPSAELSAKDLQFVHIYSPLFKTLKVDEIVNSDKLSQVKNSLSPIKNGIYSLNLNRNSKNYGNGNTMSSPNSMTATTNHLANCVPNQMLINNNVLNNNFYPANDCNSTGYNDLQSIDSDSLSMLKFWKCDQDSEKSFI